MQRKKSKNRIPWIPLGVASLLFGVLKGYGLWAETASLAANLEHDLNVSEWRVRSLERGLQFLEAHGGTDNSNASAANRARAYQSVRSISRKP